MLKSISMQAAVLLSHLIGKVSDTNVPCNLGLCRLRYCVRSAKLRRQDTWPRACPEQNSRVARQPHALHSVIGITNLDGGTRGLVLGFGVGLGVCGWTYSALCPPFLREVHNAEDLHAEYFVLASTRAGDLPDGALQCPIVLLLVPTQGFPTLVAIGSRLR